MTELEDMTTLTCVEQTIVNNLMRDFSLFMFLFVGELVLVVGFLALVVVVVVVEGTYADLYSQNSVRTHLVSM